MLNILGLQKLTLLDYPGHMACTVFLGGCNFRCPFCHNRALVVNPDFSAAMDKNEFYSFLKKRQGVLDGVCITGGEPLLSSGIFDFAKEIKEMGFKIKLDTNGSFPDRMTKLIEDKLIDYVAMDIKNSKEKYAMTIGRNSFDIAKIEKSVELLKNSNIPYEFRTTVVDELHNEEDFHKIGKWIQGAMHYYLQIYRDSEGVIAKGLNPPNAEKIEKIKEISMIYVEDAEIRGV